MVAEELPLTLESRPQVRPMTALHMLMRFGYCHAFIKC